MVAIASAAAGKAAESLTEQGKQAVAAIVRRIREKFRGRPSELAVLNEATNNHARIDELAVLLDETSAQDPEFGSHTRALWNHAGLIVTDGGVVNQFHGEANKVIQLRDVHGDLTIN